ncbi:MAG: bifunctional alpha,alpha-trehalose-phosphate synthase (UDP-forming)/trehalose-phosphatase [Bacteroidota bacterium]
MEKENLVPVFLSQQDIECFYEGFSNKVIWPHFHYFTQFTAYNQDSYWEAYKKVNTLFQEAVLSIYQEGDVIWVHDYQLMLLPAMIRTELPRASIGFFLHIPFPSYEIFRILPWRKSLLDGVLGADQIGFHTYNYMRHFLSAAYRISGIEHNFGKMVIKDRLINVDVFPMGIDYWKYAKHEVILDPRDEAFKIERMARKKKIILSIDRLDYTKGIPQRIRTFESFLETYPEYEEKVTLLLVVVPSRSSVDQYQELKAEVDSLVGRINGLYGSYDWSPIQYFYRSLPFKVLSTLYKVSQIAMITPLRDGMNLVAKEYIASKEESEQGVLILSEMAGASNELTEALIVNPHDSADIVETIRKALEMNPSEQRWRLKKMQEGLKKYDIKNWAESFVNSLASLTKKQKNTEVQLLNRQTAKGMIDAYKSADHRLLILDYDGTLMNFQNDPQAVLPDKELLSILECLCADNKNKVVINTGRDRETIGNWLGHLPIEFAAEHGVWTRKKKKWVKNPGLRNKWKPDVQSVLESMVERTPGSFIEEKDYSLAWHYRRIDKDLGAKRIREFRDVLSYLTANLDLQVLEGNKVIEIKNAGVSKGQATLIWSTAQDWDFIFAIGDDHTDEDTFKALPKEAFTVKVGDAQSAARFNIGSVEHVRSLLNLFLN